MHDSLGKYRAILLIAGKGRRMGPLTYKTPKCLLEVESGKTILDIQLDALSNAGIAETYMIIGFYGWKIKELYGSSYNKMKLRYIENPFHEITGGAHSLWLARTRFARHNSIIMDGDHVLGSHLIKKLLDSPYGNCVLVDSDRKELTEDTQIVGKNNLVKYLAWSQDGELHKHVFKEDCVGEALIIIKLTPKAASILADEIDRYVRRESGILEVITPLNDTFRRVDCGYISTEKMPWTEIDFSEDLEYARTNVYPKVKELEKHQD